MCYQFCNESIEFSEVEILGRLEMQDMKTQDWKTTDKVAGVQNAGLEIDGQKLHVVENVGHTIEG